MQNSHKFESWDNGDSGRGSGAHRMTDLTVPAGARTNGYDGTTVVCACGRGFVSVRPTVRDQSATAVIEVDFFTVH